MVSPKSTVGEKTEPPAVIVGIHAIARMLGLSRPACHELVSAGIIRRKSFGKYNAIEVATDYVAHLKRQLVAAREGNADWQAARAGLAGERRGMAEMERRKIEGELIPLDLVGWALGQILDTVKYALLGLGSRTTQKMEGMTIRQRAAFLDDLADSVVNQLGADLRAIPQRFKPGEHRGYHNGQDQAAGA
jgi:hypothetical protein